MQNGDILTRVEKSNFYIAYEPSEINPNLFSQVSFVRNSLPLVVSWVERVTWVVCGAWVFVSLGKRDAGLLAGQVFPKSGSLPVGSGAVFQFVF